MGASIRRTLAAAVFAVATSAAARAVPDDAPLLKSADDSPAVVPATPHDGLASERVEPAADRNRQGSLDTMYSRCLPEPATLWALAVGALALRPRRPRAYRGPKSYAAAKEAI